MNEYGIQRICWSCREPFTCTDGNYFCSDKCYDKWETENENVEDFKMEYESIWVGELED